MNGTCPWCCLPRAAAGDRATSPDTAYGWGIPDAVVAVGVDPEGTPDGTLIARGAPNPFREGIAFEFFLPRSEPLTARVYDAAGRLVRSLGEGRIVEHRPPAGSVLRKGRKVWLTVSLGVRKTAAPSVVGMSSRQAGIVLGQTIAQHQSLHLESAYRSPRDRGSAGGDDHARPPRHAARGR